VGYFKTSHRAFIISVSKTLTFTFWAIIHQTSSQTLESGLFPHSIQRWALKEKTIEKNGRARAHALSNQPSIRKWHPEEDSLPREQLVRPAGGGPPPQATPPPPWRRHAADFVPRERAPDMVHPQASDPRRARARPAGRATSATTSVASRPRRDTPAQSH